MQRTNSQSSAGSGSTGFTSNSAWSGRRRERGWAGGRPAGSTHLSGSTPQPALHHICTTLLLPPSLRRCLQRGRAPR